MAGVKEKRNKPGQMFFELHTETEQKMSRLGYVYSALIEKIVKNQ